jgi:hypothetical protein
MATTEDKVLNDIARQTGDVDLQTTVDEGERQPLYRMTGDTKIPVARKSGTLWKSRKDAAYTKLEQTGKISSWKECIDYYKNDQKTLRGENSDKYATGGNSRRRTRRLGQYGGAETENIVFANTSSLVPSIYAKNPSCEVTANTRDDNSEGGPDDEVRQLANTGERLVNALADKRAAPGLALKGKARKAVIMTNLTNISYLEAGYTRKEEASETALEEINILSARLQEAKSPQEIEEVEGALEALEEKIDFLNPSGPWVKFRHPMDVLRDPDSTSADLSDAKWVMIADYVSTAFINAQYREKTGDGEFKSIYQPTHVVSAGGDKSIDDQINNFSLVSDKSDYSQYGYTSDDAYRNALRTKVWYVWDKITRRVYMYNDKDWSWPIWVWDDPYTLDSFFPIFPLEFYTDPEDDIANSEVSYYLDQQDAINEINDELAFMRRWVKKNIIYNKRVFTDSNAIEKYLEGGSNQTALGIDVPPDGDISKAVSSIPPPSAQFIQLFDKKPQLEAIQRVSSVSEVMQGLQFKTNTTNDAIETYNSQMQTRLDEKIDAVEDCVGNVLWAVLQMCLQFMSQEEVAAVLGPAEAQTWTNLSAADIRGKFSVRIVGGSSVKPTSKAKKQEATQMAQVLGQFANAGQGVVVLTMLKVMERAFDELTLTREDWEFIRNSITQSIQNSNPTGAQSGAQPSAQPPTEQGVPAQAAGGAPPMSIDQMIDQLPPEAKIALGEATARGVPVAEAVAQITQLAQQAGAPA